MVLLRKIISGCTSKNKTMKQIIRDLIDTLLAIAVVCAFITPILIGFSVDMNKARTKNAVRPTIEMRELSDTTITSSLSIN